MSPEEFAAHGLWTQLDLAKTHLAEFEQSADAGQQAQINRIRFIIEYAKSFDKVPSEYFTATMLNRVQSAWESVRLSLEQFAANSKAQYLEAAVVASESCLDFIVQWPAPLSKGESLAQVTKSFRAYAAELENARNQVQEKLIEVTASVSALELRVQEDSASHDLGVVENREALAALESSITTSETRLDSAIQKIDEAFQAAEKSRDLSLREWLLKQQTEFAELAQPTMDEIVELLTRSKAAYEEIDKLRTDTANVAALATGALLADNFAASAKQERTTGFWSYIGGWAALGGGIWVYLGSFGGLTVAKLSWEAITLKFGFSAAIVGGATVAFKLGSRSFKLSSKYKQMELELRAIGPFLADVADADADKTKTNFIERSFGQSSKEDASTKEADRLETKVLENVIPRLLGMFGLPTK